MYLHSEEEDKVLSLFKWEEGVSHEGALIKQVTDFSVIIFQKTPLDCFVENVRPSYVVELSYHSEGDQNVSLYW